MPATYEMPRARINVALSTEAVKVAAVCGRRVTVSTFLVVNHIKAMRATKKNPRQSMRLELRLSRLPQLRLLSRAAGVSGDGVAALLAC
jgi:hypothetical protein